MPGSATVTINDKQWAVDIAISESELTAGLGGVASIPSQTGMLFDLGSPQTVEVTTEPMLFNIDIIFISEALEVVDVVENVAPGYLVTEATPVRYFLEVNAGGAEGVEAGDSVEITDYEYTPPSAISQWMPTIITIAMLGFVAAMVGGMARAALAPPKGLPCSRCGARIYRTGEKYYDTPAGIFCYRCVPWPYKAPEYEKVCKSPGSPRRLGEPKTEAERRETHERKYGTRELPERGSGLKERGGYGTCYEDAWRFLIREEEGELVHGSVQTIGKRINHAWVELPTGFVWEPESGEFMKKSYFYERAEPQEQARYTAEEAAIMAARTGNLGPWTEEERRQVLSLEHHSMWLTLEQRKDLQEKYGVVAVRWAEEATRPGDIRGLEAAAEYYYKKLKEVFGLGHLSPKLSEEQIRKLREVLGLTASATEVLKIHRETGYIP